ncbi:MAG: cobaltochelatase subunit CobN [Deltaproteobacteria bacterium]|nr:cobaltochelatase subunit CobN [Deltaproteobacteria bacterium]
MLLPIAILFLFPSTTFAKQISFLVIDADTCLVNKAIKELRIPENVKVRFLTYHDITKDNSAREFIDASEAIIVDVMMIELSQYLIENVDISKKRIYALRGSRDDEGLKRKGFVFDPDIQEYFNHLSVPNIQNLIYRVAHREFDPSIAYNEVVKLPRLGIYHNEADAVFTGFEEYLHWYRGRKEYAEDASWVGVLFFSSSLIEGQVKKVDYLIKRLEDEGFNVVAAFGRDLEVLTSLLMDKNQRARVDLIIAFSLKFYSALNEKIRSTLLKLNVPIFNAINLYSNTIDEWRSDPIGIPPMDVVWTIANPEISGLIEPSPLTGKVKLLDEETGKVLFVHKPIKENIELVIPRLKMWVQLKKKENKNKRVAILYYNHGQGKQNVGASYLNVFKSLELIIQRMKKEGYQVTFDRELREDAIKDLVLKYGRNIGSWAPGELDKMLGGKKVIRLPVKMYQKWFARLPEEFRKNVIKQWGKVEDSTIMIKNGEFIIPAIILGNVLIMPEPARGWGDDPMKLYHDPTLYPHHQYIAAYLWLKHAFDANAMIHLGTHATHEWLPGKQAGLSHSCPPEVLITDIPNIYPYIVDDVGEGIQAKRRGRGVIIDHLVPAVKEAGLYHEYSQLYDMISSYNRAVSLGSQTAGGKLEKIGDMVTKMGLLNDLGITEFNEACPRLRSGETLEEIEHYLLEIRENFMPYGLHTFGISPEGEALRDTVKAISKRNSQAREEEVKKGLVDSGPREIGHLIKALEGGYIPSGEGNDPIRNVAAIPTGKNFFGFNPDKIPSPAAWDLGKKAAEQIIKKSLKEKKRYPEKVAIVLWATETIRNEGINESTILYLMGLKPTRDKTGRVTGTEVIPGRKLNRPRIDILINPSGLYRDLFPNMLLFLDRAVQKAALQTDIENLISRHNAQMKTRLIESGMGEERAGILSRVRIFTEKPGSYGTGVCEMTGASGLWESDDEIVKVYENRVGYAFGQGKWGEEAKEIFKENLKVVDVAVHSISSNIYGTMDNDDVFQYLGGLSLAVKKESGETPDTLITMQRIPDRVEVENIARTIGRELRTRYLNPKWIEGMKKEKYAGAREMSKFVEYMWGWQVTVPYAIDRTKWEQTYDVYVEDKYGLEMKDFFNRANPWAYQSIAARMLESIRKGYWKADEKIKKKLGVEYVLNVIDKGVACCDHTCNNPVLNQMVVNIISLPGVMSPEMVERFKLAIEQAMGKALADQIKARKDLQKKLNEGFTKKTQPPDQKASRANAEHKEEVSKQGTESKMVEGYKMEEVKAKDDTTDLPSSGVQWFASLFVIFIMGLAILGAKKYNGTKGNRSLTYDL